MRAGELAALVGSDLVGEDFLVEGVCTMQDPAPRCVGFIKRVELALSFEPGEGNGVFIAPTACRGQLTYPHILVDNPRGAFMRILTALYPEQPRSEIASSAYISPDAVVGENVRIGHGTVIGPGVVIGDHTEIRNHVVIAGYTTIGKRCVLKSHCVIAEDGLGLEYDEDGVPRKIPHVGHVEIGDDVEVGSFNTVCRGTVGATTIGSGTKMDDHVHIAHNCQIGRNCIITAHAELSGSVKVGDRSWLAPNCSIMNGLTLGEGVFIGIGAVVTRDCEPNWIYAGSPARKIKARP
jgi:UDP-3-O-[3-hydroxymyristoyl] glucosamine N-acyltransferase